MIDLSVISVKVLKAGLTAIKVFMTVGLFVCVLLWTLFIANETVKEATADIVSMGYAFILGMYNGIQSLFILYILKKYMHERKGKANTRSAYEVSVSALKKLGLAFISVLIVDQIAFGLYLGIFYSPSARFEIFGGIIIHAHGALVSLGLEQVKHVVLPKSKVVFPPTELEVLEAMRINGRGVLVSALGVQEVEYLLLPRSEIAVSLNELEEDEYLLVPKSEIVVSLNEPFEIAV
jgi:hypothetical protein